MLTTIKLRFHAFSRTLFLGLFFAFACIPAYLNAQAPAPAIERPTQPPPGTTGPAAGKFYKNLKVLKDIPAVDLHPAMEYITIALGVGCPYCHDLRKFDSDDKPTKRTARNMMQMMFAIDNTVFHGEERVTCYTCHRGQPKGAAVEVLPGEKQVGVASAAAYFRQVAIPNIVLDSSMSPVKPDAPGGPSSTAPASAPNAAPPVVLPSVDEVFAKYMEALGSPDAIRKASTLVERGKVEMEIPLAPGAPPAPPTIGHLDAEIFRKAPDKALYRIHLPTVVSTEGYNGFTAWLGGTIAREETGGERGVVQIMAEFFPALRFKDTHTQVKVESIEKIDGHEAYRVSGFRQDGTGFDHVYVDTQTGLLLRLSTSMNSIIGSFPVENNYDDYRDVSGLKLPFTVRQVSPEGDRVYKWDRIEFNGQVEDAVFNMPPPPPPAGPPPGGTPPPAGGPPR